MNLSKPGLVRWTVSCTLGCGVLIGSVVAQAKTGRELRKAKKLAEPWLKSADWSLSLPAAKARAARGRKLIFAYVTRSYTPSPPCRALERGPLSNKAFRKFADSVVLFCHVTTGIAKDQDLLRRNGGRSFPYMVLMDSRGVVLHEQRARSVVEFERSRRHVEVLATLDKPRFLKDNSIAVRVLLAKSSLGMLSHAESKFASKRLQFTKQQRLELDGILADIEVGDLYIELTAAGERASIPARFFALKRAVRLPRHAVLVTVGPARRGHRGPGADARVRGPSTAPDRQGCVELPPAPVPCLDRVLEET